MATGGRTQVLTIRTKSKEKRKDEDLAEHDDLPTQKERNAKNSKTKQEAKSECALLMFQASQQQDE